MKTPYVYQPVPKLFPGGVVAIIASGPSLTKADVDYVRGRVSGVIVINDNYQIAPWADVLYATDGRWWHWHKKEVQSFAGLKYAVGRSARAVPGVQLLKGDKDNALSLDPTSVSNVGLNSGYVALNVAVHLGASRIVLLGYDMSRGPKGEEHWHGEHRNRSRSPYHVFQRKFMRIVDPLQAIGVDVVNCSRRTALTCFPQAPLEEALSLCAA